MVDDEEKWDPAKKGDCPECGGSGCPDCIEEEDDDYTKDYDNSD